MIFSSIVDYFDRLFNRNDYTPHEKARRLFLSHCTPQQLKCHQKHGAIIVKGSATGLYYIIVCKGFCAMNIWRIHDRMCMCAMIKGRPKYDVFLVQKLIIENYELDFLNVTYLLPSQRKNYPYHVLI